MIGYLEGALIENRKGHWLIAVGSTEVGRVGYRVHVPAHERYLNAAKIGSRVVAHIHTHVREDALDLYGFIRAEEKELFETLISVSGIGPKGALGILSHTGPEAVLQAILAEDKATLNKMPGVGKKTAERLVLELKDRLTKRLNSGEGPDWNILSGMRTQDSRTSDAVGAFQDARMALLGLGYHETVVTQVLNRLLKSEISEDARPEEWIRQALKELKEHREPKP